MDILRVENLCRLLEAHLDKYQRLIDYILDEKKMLIELDLEALLESAQAKEELGRQIEVSVKTLAAAITETSLMFGLPEEARPTLSELADHCPKPFDNRLNDGAIKLARLKNIILRENEANKAFVAEALNLVNGSINILTGASQLKGDGYGKDGMKNDNKSLTRPVKLSREV